MVSDFVMKSDFVIGVTSQTLLHMLATVNTYHRIHYAGLRFCIGAVTAILQRGILEMKIKMLGRWESPTYQLLCTPHHELASIPPPPPLNHHFSQVMLSLFFHA